jgi:D-aspartate ligase
MRRGQTSVVAEAYPSQRSGTIPVVVVGGSLNALGVVRSLTSGNIPIPTMLLETTHRCPSRWSRHCRFVRIASIEGEALVDELKALSARIGRRPVLILTDDRAVETVSAIREELEPFYNIQLPPKAIVPVLADKTLFQQLAEREGLPVPRSVILRHPSDVHLLACLTLPLVIKPANKAFVLNSGIERAVRVDSHEQAQDVATRLVARANGLIAQEWIDGPDTELFFSFFVCDAQSNVKALFHGRKVVCEPPRVGNTALCAEAHDTTGELDRLTRKYISVAGYVGIGGLEFKRDMRTGQFTIIEPTVGRTDWQEEIATLCGVNIPLLAYRTALGHSSEFIRAESRLVAWRSSRAHRAPAGQLPRGTRLVDGHFRLTDPLPGIYYYGFERFTVRLWNLITQPGQWIERAARLGGRK